MTGIDKAQALCRDAEALLILAGAGMGVDSGLPDFRGNEGFWNAYPPYRRLGFNFMEMANPARFVDDPEIGWGFYGHRLNLYRNTTPHAGFTILREFGDSLPSGTFVFTSNVDGHFQQAGFDPGHIVECHGSIRHLQCLQDCRHRIWSAENVEVTVDEETMRAIPPLPSCPDCGELARPNILMFGDWGWISPRADTQEGRYRQWLDQARDKRLLILEFGAGTAVPTVRHQSEMIAANLPSARLIRVNLREPQVPARLKDRAVGIPGRALETIRALLG